MAGDSGWLSLHCAQRSLFFLTQVAELNEEQKAYMAQVEAAKMEAAAGAVDTKGPTTFFHGKEEKDYQGRYAE